MQPHLLKNPVLTKVSILPRSIISIIGHKYGALLDDVDSAMEEERGAKQPAHVVLKKLERALEEFRTYMARRQDSC